MPIGNSLAVIRSVVTKIKRWVVSTYAGQYFGGLVNNVETFNYIDGIVADSSGNLYVSDTLNNAIRKITSSGVVSTFAGALVTNSDTIKGNSGFNDGTGTGARFNYPRSICIDSFGNLYVADTNNNAIRKITPNRIVTTFAGGSKGTTDGKGTVAKFSAPMNMCIDSSNNLYVTEWENHAIRKITPSGDVTTFAGNAASGDVDGNNISARFGTLYDICIDSSGNLYVIDISYKKIRKITPNGNVSTYITDTNFRKITIDSNDNIYASINYLIYKITPNKDISLFANKLKVEGNVDGPIDIATLSNITCIKTDSDNNIYVSHNKTNYGTQIRKITQNGSVITIAGHYENGYFNTDVVIDRAKFYNPRGICKDSFGNLYVADTDNNAIRKITPNRIVSTFAGPEKSFVGNIGAYIDDEPRLHSPGGYTIDNSGGIYFTSGTNIVKNIPTQNNIVKKFVNYINNGIDITKDSSGNFFVSQGNVNTISKVTPSNNEIDSPIVTIFAGITGIGSNGYINSSGTNSKFNTVYGITIDSSDNLYVCDYWNNAIRKITSSGVVTTFAGSGPSSSGSNDGTGTGAKFKYPIGICIDTSQNLYVTDAGNHTIRKITLSGVVTTFAGTAGKIGKDDGNGASSSFNTPYGITSDLSNNIYICDSINHTIRKITPLGDVTTFAGTAGNTGIIDGLGSEARFNSPQWIIYDAISNTLLVSDTGNKKIRKITMSGLVTTYLGSFTGAASPYSASGAVNTYDIKCSNDSKHSSFRTPMGMVVDSTDSIYVCDSGNHIIRKITQNGNYGIASTFAGMPSISGFKNNSNKLSLFNKPTDITIDSSGNFYVCDFGNKAIRKITPTGGVSTFVQYTDENPFCITIDSSGNLYHTVNTSTPNSASYNKIYKVTPSGISSIFAGAGPEGYIDGSNDVARFKNPIGLHCDENNNILVADKGNFRIRSISPSGEVSTIAGLDNVSNGKQIDGTVDKATFIKPSSIISISPTEMYVTDSNNIRKIYTT